MLWFILAVLLLLIVFIAYIFVIKPYQTIQSIKKEFESKGYKVLVQKLDFTDDTLTSTMLHDKAVHKDALHRYKTTWQDYDLTIKNSFFAVIVTLNSIELIKEAYRKIQFLDKPAMIKNNFARFYGGGLLMRDGPQWKIKRKLYSEIFNFKLLQQLHPIVEKTIENSMKKWKINQKVDLLNQFRTMYFDVFVACYFGRQFNQFKYQDQSYSQAVATSFQELLAQGVSLRHMLFGTKFVQKGFFKEDKIIEDRVSAIKIQTKQFVQKRLAQIQQCQRSQQHSILSKLVFNDDFKELSKQDKVNAIQSITGDVIMFFFAGTDSNSAALAATIHLLNKHPQTTKQLIEQLNVFGKDYLHSTLKNWKYMDSVLNEVLRLYGPFNWIFVRQILTNDFSVGGVTLPKDTILGIQTHTIHHSQKFYENPNEFRPERFLTQKNADPYSFVAFGGGQRNCIGQYLARIQYKVGLGMFLREFNFCTQDELVMDTPSIYLSINNNFRLERRQD